MQGKATTTTTTILAIPSTWASCASSQVGHKASAQVVEESLRHAELEVADVDWLVLHQANQRILDSAAERLKFPPERVVSNLAKYGNTSAASIPLALDEAVRAGSIQPGHTVSHAGVFPSFLGWYMTNDSVIEAIETAVDDAVA